MERRREVDRQRLVPFLGRKLLDRREMPDHGIVDKDIDRTETAEQFGHHGFDR